MLIRSLKDRLFLLESSSLDREFLLNIMSDYYFFTSLYEPYFIFNSLFLLVYILLKRNLRRCLGYLNRTF